MLEWTDFEQFAEHGYKITDIVARYGGRDIAYDQTVVLEGDYHPESALIIEFESMSQLMACYQPEEYAPYKSLRQGCGRMNVLAVDGLHDEAAANGAKSS